MEAIIEFINENHEIKDKRNILARHGGPTITVSSVTACSRISARNISCVSGNVVIKRQRLMCRAELSDRLTIVLLIYDPPMGVVYRRHGSLAPPP